MSVRVDFSGAGGFDPIPTGTYLVKVTDVVEEVSKAGNPMLTWSLQVAEGEHEGSKLKLWTALTKKAAFKLKELLEALGETISLEELDIEPADYIGKSFVVQVLLREEEDKNTGLMVERNDLVKFEAA